MRIAGRGPRALHVVRAHEIKTRRGQEVLGQGDRGDHRPRARRDHRAAGSEKALRIREHQIATFRSANVPNVFRDHDIRQHGQLNVLGTALPHFDAIAQPEAGDQLARLFRRLFEQLDRIDFFRTRLHRQPREQRIPAGADIHHDLVLDRRFKRPLKEIMPPAIFAHRIVKHVVVEQRASCRGRRRPESQAADRLADDIGDQLRALDLHGTSRDAARPPQCRLDLRQERG